MPHLRLFGPAALVDAGGKVLPLRSRKHLALLMYLALEPRRWPIRRDALTALLWHDVPHRRARRSLSQAMLQLRRQLGEEVVPSREREVRLGSPISTDLDLLEHGTELPHGDLTKPLLGLDDVGGPNFAHWLDRARARLRDAAQGVLARQLEQARREGDAHRVHERAVQLYEVDPLSELAIQALCEQAVVEGDVAGAAKRLRAHMAHFESETGLPVSDGLQRLQQLIEEGHLATRRVDATAPRASRHRRPEAFIGRRQELSCLEQQWEAVQRGGRRTCLVAGPAGIGKSSLLVRFSTSVAVRAAVVLEVSCQEIGSNIPFAAVSDLLAALARYPAALGTDPRWLAEACRVAPGLKSRISGIPEPPPVPPDAVRVRTAQALIRIIEVVAEDDPVLLVLDDLAYLDPASRDILHLLLHRLERARLLFVGAARTTGEMALAWQDPQARVATSWDETLPLRPLPEVDVREMITALCGGEPPGEAVEGALIELADGNPYLVEMLLSEWRRQPKGSLVDGHVRGDEATARWRPSEMMHRVFERQHRGLSADADHMLSLLAVAGRKLSAGETGRLLGVAPGTSDAAALELLDRGVVRIEDGGLSFKNQLHRAYAYATMGEEHRKFLHGQLAKLLDDGHTPETFQELLAASHHYAAAGMMDSAIRAVKSGSEFAIERGGAGEAERSLVRLYKQVPAPARPSLLLLLAMSQAAQGRHPEAISTLSGLSDATLSLLERSTAALVRAESLQRARLASDQQIDEALRTALGLAVAVGDETQRLRAVQLRAEFSCEAGESLNEALEVAQSIAAEATTTHIRALAHLTMGYCKLVSGNTGEAGRDFRVATRTFRATSHELELRRALNGLAIHCLADGDLDGASSILHEAALIAERSGDLDGAANSWSNLGAVYDDMGNVLDAASCYDDATRNAVGSGNQRRLAELTINVAGLAMTLGEFAQARELLYSAIEIANITSHWRLHAEALFAQADLEIAARDLDAAWGLVEEANEVRANRLYPLSDMGRFERIQRHYLWSTRGLQEMMRHAAEVPLRQQCPQIADRLEVEAFHEWVMWQEGLERGIEATAVKELMRMRLLGIVTWLHRVGAIHSPPKAEPPQQERHLLLAPPDIAAAASKCLSLAAQLRSDRTR
jgi:DNA-binding SARP family transcriptional activator/tetratricopeptide (TPR) repeat protein